MSVGNPWVPGTPIKPSLKRSSPEEENQQKSGLGEAQRAGEALACPETPNFVVISSEGNLVVDLNGKNWDDNRANFCSISGFSEKTETDHRILSNNEAIPQISKDAVSSKTIFHFMPMTPDKMRNGESKQLVQLQSLPIEDDRGGEGKGQECQNVNIRMDDNGVQQMDDNGVQHKVYELVFDSSSANILTPFKENLNKESNIITVNEVTQPKQKRRRKHRPKVVVEGKSKTPKSVTTENSKENSTAKRKYVRKNLVNKSEEAHADFGTPYAITPGAAGYKENPTGKRKYVSKNSVNKPLEAPADFGTPNPVTPGATGSMEKSKGKRKRVCKNSVNILEEARVELGTPNPVTSGATGSMEKSMGKRKRGRKTSVNILEEAPAELGSLNPITPGATNPKENSTSIRTYARKTCRKSLKFGNEGEQKDEGSLYKTFSEISESQAHVFATNGEVQSHSIMQYEKRDVIFDHRQVSIVYDLNSSGMSVEYCSSPLKLHSNYQNEQENLGRIHSGASIASTSTISTENQKKSSNRKRSHSTKLGDIKSSDILEEFYNSISADQMSSLGPFPHIHNKLQPFKSPQTSDHVEMSHRRLEARGWSNKQSTYSWEQLPVTHSPPCYAQADRTQATMARKKQKRSLSSVTSNRNGTQPHTELTFYNHSQTSQIFSGAPLEVNLELSINLIVEMMEVLDINREKRSVYKGQNAVIPYNMQTQAHNSLAVYGRDGFVAPFEGILVPVRKRRPHAKVDLDGETLRVWKLLMGNFDSEGIDGSDEAKVKWWEEERRVFCGRADSFIARMHLIQGDRGFSKWKGSVLDSVIGVFLTQNVSDHLSSSAFMSLAAHFPLKSRNPNKSCFDGTSSVVDEPGASAWKAEHNIRWNENISDQPLSTPIFMTEHETGQSAEKVITTSESTGSNTEGFSFMHESQLLTSDYSGQKIGESESRISTAEINLSVELCSLGGGNAKDAAISSEMPICSQNSVNTSSYVSVEDSRSCLKSNSLDMLNHSKSTTVNASALSVENAEITETTLSKRDMKNACDNDSSDDKSRDNPRSSLRNSPCHSSDHQLQKTSTSGVTEVECSATCREETPLSNVAGKSEYAEALDYASQTNVPKRLATSAQATKCPSKVCNIIPCNQEMIEEHQGIESETSVSNHKMHQPLPNLSVDTIEVTRKTDKSVPDKRDYSLGEKKNDVNPETLNSKAKKVGKEKEDVDWDSLRKQAESRGRRERTFNTMDSVDWEAVRCADVGEIAYTIRERGMNNRLAERIKDFLNRLMKDHGSIDLEWLRDVSPNEAKEYLLSVKGLGLKSVECVRLLTLHQLAFPVDTNVGRIAVRLGWVPIQPLPESLQLHLLELYPVLESIQKYLWPRLCKLDQRTLYELHYQLITFGKVFCTKSKPNCNACPMRGDCRHFASAFASARLALPAPEEKSLVDTTERKADMNPAAVVAQQPLSLTQASKPTEKNQLLSTCLLNVKSGASNIEPIIEEPATPEPECPHISENDIEDALYEDSDEIPTIKLNIEAFTKNLQNYVQENMELQEGSMSKALVVLSPEAASIPTPKLKYISRLRTEHQVYELPDSHPLLDKLKLEQREPDDPCFYLLAIWGPGETANSTGLLQTRCSSQENGKIYCEMECCSCNNVGEENSQVVRGTLLIPCRTAMRGSFPLNGTYFQVNEVFADHDSSLNPIDVPRAWLWNLSRRTVHFGTSIPTIFKGLSTEAIQHCFWRGYVCVRGFDRKTQAPRPLVARLHFPASKLTATKGKTGKPDDK